MTQTTRPSDWRPWQGNDQKWLFEVNRGGVALAREVAVAIVAYRAAHKLSQRALADKLGWKPSVVSRLEAAEHNPSIDTLLELSRKLGLKMRIEVAPEPGVPVKVTKARAA